jgi:hypothetical protein
MDDRNGNLYPTRDAALAAGVPAKHAVEVEVETVRVASGPFKGRVYRRFPGGRIVRAKDLE